MMKKQFYLEGERITLRCAKELIGREQYKKALSNAKAAFLRNPLRGGAVYDPRGDAHHRVSAGLNCRRSAAFSLPPVAAAFALCRGGRSCAAPCRVQIQPRPAALRGAGKAQGIIRLIALHGAARGGELRQRF